MKVIAISFFFFLFFQAHCDAFALRVPYIFGPKLEKNWHVCP